MKKEVTCPWCNEKTVPKIEMKKKQHGDVKERRCTECGKVLAAYLEGERDFLPGIRTFEV